ncbi:PqqD family protein [Actinoalloteichus spitiensis]|uniref:PqqD family protein n=1 Tax=Actinoalloteichus spitiensis TaxID=252394 RepID=UPI00035D2FA3|nr:PqqD family protein [Actinoalloteichus spitiensis]
MTTDSRVQSAEHHDGSLVLIAEHTGKIYQCSPTASLMWRTIEEIGDLDHAADTIAARCGITVVQARSDLDAFVATLAEHRLTRGTSKSGRNRS